MTGVGMLTSNQLRGILNSPIGVDVYAGDQHVRALLSREERQQDDGNGFTVGVFVTALTILDADLPNVRDDDQLDIGPCRALWNAPPDRKDCARYVVRRVGRVDDVGARELLIAEVTR